MIEFYVDKLFLIILATFIKKKKKTECIIE